MSGKYRFAIALSALVLVTLATATLSPVALARPVVLPFALRLEGVGAFYGAAGGLAGETPEETTALAAVSRGAVDAAGGAFITPRWGVWRLTALGGAVSRAALETSYTRGFAPDAPVRQTVSGNGAGLILRGAWAEDRWRAHMGVAKSTVVLEDFRTTEGDRIPLPEANLHDVESGHLLLGIGYDSTGGEALPTSGLRVSLDGVTLQGRTGQSDAATLTAAASAYIPLGTAFSAAVHARRSAAAVLAEAPDYNSAADVRAALAADCDAVSDPQARDDCRALEDDLVAYIAANNRHGTAAPLGGSGGLRAYRELRFRAAHTALGAVALRWTLRPPTDTLPLQASVFWESGYVADDAAELLADARRSVGMGLRAAVAAVPVRLEAARDDVSAWFLTVGAPF